MRVLIEQQLYELSTLRDFGGEGEIYPLDSTSLAKIYHEDMVNRQRQEKVLALCARYATFKGLLGEDDFALPQIEAQSDATKEIVGFKMRDLGLLPQLTDLGYDTSQDAYNESTGCRLDDTRTLALIYKMFASLERLHSAKIILGDVNPSNILYDDQAQKPVFIDLDASSFDVFECEVVSPEYCDPQVEKQGKSLSNHLKYTSQSDVFSLTVIAYELFVGANPYHVATSPTTKVADNKHRGISLLGQQKDSLHLPNFGLTLLASPFNTGILKRIEALQSQDPILHEYFYDVLIKGRRNNLVKRLKKSDPRNPLSSFYGGETIITRLKKGWPPTADIEDLPQTKVLTEDDLLQMMGNIRSIGLRREAKNTNDPNEFKALVNNMGIPYEQLVATGGQ